MNINSVFNNFYNSKTWDNLADKAATIGCTVYTELRQIPVHMHTYTFAKVAYPTIALTIFSMAVAQPLAAYVEKKSKSYLGGDLTYSAALASAGFAFRHLTGFTSTASGLAVLASAVAGFALHYFYLGGRATKIFIPIELPPLELPPTRVVYSDDDFDDNDSVSSTDSISHIEEVTEQDGEKPEVTCEIRLYSDSVSSTDSISHIEEVTEQDGEKPEVTCEIRLYTKGIKGKCPWVAFKKESESNEDWKLVRLDSVEKEEFSVYIETNENLRYRIFMAENGVDCNAEAYPKVTYQKTEDDGNTTLDVSYPVTDEEGENKPTVVEFCFYPEWQD